MSLNGFPLSEAEFTDFSQCLVMASVVSMMVPSKSNKKPANVWVSDFPVKDLLHWFDVMVETTKEFLKSTCDSGVFLLRISASRDQTSM